jgi:hypothetical protein
MYVFVDEAGTFQIPSDAHNVSCVVALIVPESFASTLFRRFRKTIRPWITEGREVKGSRLDERQVAAIVALLRRFDVAALAVCVDMGLHTDAVISAHKNGQADALRRSVRPTMTASLRDDILLRADRMAALSNQLYVQFVALTELVAEVFHRGLLYYVQRIPATLGAFKWRIDAKDKSITRYESLWTDIGGGLLQTMSFEKPLATLEGADYSAFARFSSIEPHAPPHLAHMVEDPTAPFPYVDIKRILSGDLDFAQSHRYCGLQIVDIIATSLRRACNGKLQRAGWRDLPRLVLQREDQKNTLRFISLDPNGSGRRHDIPYADVIRDFDANPRRMLTPSLRQRGSRS